MGSLSLKPNVPPFRVAQIVDCTEAEGPGRRLAIWVQGCPLRCPGCCNPEFLPNDDGTMMTVDDLAARISRAKFDEQLEGVTFLGGEPMMQAQSFAELATRVRLMGLSVMVFSGYTIDELCGIPFAGQLLTQTDILVDGPYLRDQSDSARRWIGSTNQRIHFLTDRYSVSDPCWKKPNTLEIRLTSESLTVNGFPAKSVRSLWTRPRPLPT